VIGYFKDRNSFQVPALLFLALILKITYVNNPHHDAFNNAGGILPNWLATAVFPKIHQGFVAGFAVTVIFLSALYANYLLTSRRMFSRSNLLVGASMIMFTSLFPSSNQFSATTLLLPFLILFFQQITRLYNATKVRPIILNIGMLMGAGYLLYHPFIWMLPCCFIGLAGMRAFRITEWLLLILGIVTPAYFLLSYEFLTDQWHPLLHVPNWKLYTQLPKPSILWWIAAGTAAVWLLAGLAGWQQQTRRMLIQGRKNWYQLIYIGLFLVPMALFPSGNASETMTLLAFPAASLAANAFASQQKSLGPVVLFWLIIAAIIVTGWMFNHA
jgi:hypothetical protein